MPDLPPEIQAPELQSYEIIEKIGEGGMGMVFSAKRRKTGEKVAMKLMHPELAEDKDAVKRFVEISRKVMALKHPSIVGLYEVGVLESTGQPFVVMEHLEGTDLGELLSEHRVMDFSRALDLARQVSGALEAAHDAGVLHMDINPSNVFVLPEGGTGGGERVKLLDFGATCLTEKSVRAAGEPGIGTPEYWSPEQASGQELDQRSDLYSLGVVIYEALSGGPPFISHSYSELVFQHLRHEPPELVRIPGNPTDPEAVRAVVRRSLHKDPQRRFQSAKELSRAVAAVPRQRLMVLADEDKPASASPGIGDGPRPRRSRALAIGLTIGVLGVAAMLALGFWLVGKQQSRPERSVEAASIASRPTAPQEARFVSITFTSEPAGAYVYETGGGPPMGKTPLKVQMTRRDRPMTVLFRFPDGARSQLEIVPDRAIVAHAQSPNLARGAKRSAAP